jgi:hypothetical protein
MSYNLKPGRIAFLVLALVLAWGCYLRFANLGLNTLASDEMNHYFVGQSLNQAGEPLLPSGVSYTRGLEYSTLVAAALPRFSQVEVAVRFPSALIGSLCLVVFAVIGWRVAGPWPAVFGSLLLSMYPEALRLSRFGRFYTLQLLGGLVAFYAGWRLLRDPLTPEGFNRRRLLRDWGWALLTLLSLRYAASVQLTTLSVAAGLGLVVVVIGARDLRLFGRQAWRWSVPWQLTALAAFAILLLATFRFELLRALFQEARTVPMWARLSAEGPGPISAYYRALSGHFPLVISLSPLIFLVALFQNRRLGGLLLSWFAVPILLHSLVFPWKSERYVLLAIPALLLATGIAASVAAVALYRYLTERFEAYPLLARPWGRIALLATVSIVLCAIITTPAFNTARRLVTARESAGWEESIALFARRPELASLPLGSAQPLVALHYWGRLDFTVQRALLESWSRDSTTGSFDNPYRMKEMGSPDVYAGRPTLTTAEAIRQRFGERGSVIIGIDQKYFTYDNIDPSLREALEREGQELCDNHCGSMRLYHWTFGQTGHDSAEVTSSTVPRGP